MFLIIVIAIITFIIYRVYDNHVNFRLNIRNEGKRTLVKANFEIIYANSSFLILNGHNDAIDVLYDTIAKYTEKMIMISNSNSNASEQLDNCKLQVKRYVSSQLPKGLLIENSNHYNDVCLIVLGYYSRESNDILIFCSKYCSEKFRHSISNIVSDLQYRLNDLRTSYESSELLF